MTDLLKFAEDFHNLASQNKILLVKTDADIIDFTKPFAGKLLILGGKTGLTADISTKERAVNVYYQLVQVLSQEQVTTVFWNVKNLISYVRFRLPPRGTLDVFSRSVDLRLVESFLGINLPSPKTLAEALKRLSPYLQNEKCKTVHNLIHKPLSFVVLPEMETYKNLIDTTAGDYVYTSYEVEGQAFGRLNCHKSFDKCITPHNLSGEKKAELKLSREKDCFVHFDFKHMEPTVLQWLSGDPLLRKVIDGCDDVYRGVYRLLFDEVCDSEEKRTYIKNLFLPIMFGLQPGTMSREHAMSYAEAESVHARVRRAFPAAWDYLESRQGAAATDHFGRPRTFDKPWAVRGFLVQAAAAMVCQEKLIALHGVEGGRLLYSVHDGYFLVANQENLSNVILGGVKVLHGESNLCPGLKLRVSCSAGKTLTQMKKIPLPKGD